MSNTTPAIRFAIAGAGRCSARVALAGLALGGFALAGIALPQSEGADPQQTPPPAPVAPEAEHEQEPEPPPRIEPIRPLEQPGGGRDELQQLFVEVERSLRRIDELLWDASAGDGALGADVDSGISKLLQDSREASRQVTDSIDRILEIAKSESGGGSGGSLGPPPPPQEQGGDPGEQQRQDGDVPEQEQGQQPEGEQPGGEKPESGEPEQDPADANQAAGAPDSGGLQPGGHGDDAERWGELPLRVREVFRAEGSEEMPTRYRHWIDTYYRRLGQDR